MCIYAFEKSRIIKCPGLQEHMILRARFLIFKAIFGTAKGTKNVILISKKKKKAHDGVQYPFIKKLLRRQMTDQSSPIY